MTDKFAIYSGSMLDSSPPKFYWKNQKYKNLIGYAKNLKEAKKIFNKVNLEENKWSQIVCLTTFDIIESQMSIDANKNVFKDCYSSDDEYYENRRYINQNK
jgi:hypothetical protein